MNTTHKGVLIPEDMMYAPISTLDAYAAKVKQGNRAFIEAHFTLEDAAARLSMELDA